MSLRLLRPRPLALAVAALVAASGLSFHHQALGHVVIGENGQGIGPSAATVDHSAQAKYIVRFNEAPLALYDGSLPGLQSVPHVSESGRAKLDVHSDAAQAYVAYVDNTQATHVAAMNTLLGRNVPVEHKMMYALNAVVVTLTGAEAQRLAQMDGVASVTRDTYEQLQTDIGPGFIGAANIWWGASAGVDTMFAGSFDSNPTSRGEGIVVADIDTGYNSNSPSFAGTDDSGYTFVNPLGAGNYLGLCSPSFPEQPAATLYTVPFAGCNNKVIGAYDFIDAPPPGAGPFSAEDYQGHGSHTASTAAGNTRDGTIGSYNARISGVAPHANMVIYYACSSSGCPQSATAAAVDQAVQDSVVDSLNFSIRGGKDPWNLVTSLAFLGATDAGIFIAAAAGNTSTAVPNAIPGTADHFEPWVTSVAAANHSGGPLGYFLTSGAGSIGMNTAPASAQPGTPITNTLVVSPNFNAANDCAALPAGTFTGKFAIMHFVNGPCGTNGLAANAKAAGAAQVLLVNSADDYINAGAAQSIPVFTTTSVQGNALATFVQANSGATGNVSYPANSRLPVTADSLASFSLLGPAKFDVIKPDVQAPGVSILAAFNNANKTGAASGPNVIAFDDGTSMATPHVTGSAALLLGLHPDWTPMEVKSALMMTAKEEGLTKPDHVTPSDFYDRGAGRVQDDIAGKAGLVLNETGLNFLAADPAQGGDPKKLNLASMQNSNCVTLSNPSTSTPTCTFTRKFRSTQANSVTYTAALTGVGGTVSPNNFAVVAHGTRSVNITVDASAFASDGTAHFGELVLTPSDTDLPTLHLPIAVALQPPQISVTPDQLSLSIASSSTTKSGTLKVTNLGGPTLNVTSTNDSTVTTGEYVVLDQPSQGNFGDYSDFLPDKNQGIYLAEDFQTTAASTNLTKLSFPGFVTGTTALAGPITFQVYTDNAGSPSGNPETGSASYAWSFTATVGTTPGLTVTNNTIAIDLEAAGAPPTALAPGRYWITVYPRFNSTAGPWAWFESTTTFGNDAHVINPQGFFQIGPNWIAITDPLDGDTYPGLAMHVQAKVACGAPWLSATPSSLTLGGLASADVTVTVDSTQFPAASTSASGFLCLDSNDPNFPILAVPVTATQN
jgi:subtilisin family serine protease